MLEIGVKSNSRPTNVSVSASTGHSFSSSQTGVAEQVVRVLPREAEHVRAAEGERVRVRHRRQGGERGRH